MEGHDFVDGKCVNCGYACQHPNAYSDTDFVTTSYENTNDPYSHKAIGTRVDYDYCPDCYQRLNPVESSYSNLEEHYFYDENGNRTDACSECGYVCQHGEINISYSYSAKTYENVGSQSRHRVNGTKTIRSYCRFCDKLIAETTVDATYYEGHSFDGKGVCQYCGYVCPHEHVHTETEEYYEEGSVTYKDTGDNKTHIEVRKARQYTYCEDCYSRVGDPVETTMELTRTHDYENNTCFECGHVNSCQHPNKEARLDERANWNYEKYDNDEFHHVTYTEVYVNYCPDCDTWLSGEVVKQETVTVDRAHEFNRQGVCYRCGYVRNCDHANAFDRQYDWYDESTYEDTGSNATHLRYVETTTRKYCPDCAKWLGSETPSTDKYEENHEYDANGVCKLCGHKNACEHVRTSKVEYFKTTTGYTAINETEHSRNGLRVTALRCNDCYTDLEVFSSEAASETELHEFGWDNICNVCGYKNVCKHENILKGYDGYFEDTDFVKPVNDKVHRIAGYYWTSDICQDCGKQVSESEEYRITTEAHSFDENDVCVECGYKRVCSHANVSSWAYYSTGRATYTNIGHRLVHQATPVTSRILYCLDCGKELENEIVHTSETELMYHDFDSNGVCRDCGYVNTCAHEHTKTDSYFKGTAKITDIGSDAVHELKGRQMITYTYCTDCYATISKTTQPFGTITEAHSYQNGVCTECGHVNQCGHANTESKTYISGSVKDSGNDKTHTESGYQFEQVVCKDCGMTLSSKLISRSATAQVEHKYVDKMCVLCGHIQSDPAPAATESTSSSDNAVTEAKTLVYEAVSENTVVNGVKVADKLPLAEAMKIIGETLDKEMADGNVTVEIPGIDKVLNQEEKSRFDKLPVKDRMLVVLSALGFEEAMGDTVNDMSADAKALAEDIAKRYEGMSSDEKQALLNVIAEFFPQTTVTIDGKDYSAFSIDLIVDRNGEKSYDRYTFYNDGSQWILYSIEVGQYVDAETV